MRAVVTGAGGFIGWHLVDALSRRGDAVQAWVRPSHKAGWEAPVETADVDIVESEAVSRSLVRFAPDVVFHLAAQSLPGRSWEDPVLTYKVNVLGALHLLEAVRALPRPPRVLMAGSSAEYAELRDERPIAEGAPTDPNSPYGGSKLAVDQIVRLYWRRYDLDLVRFRPFFLAGPRKTGDVCSDFARRIVSIERGNERTMRVGSLDVVRDIIDIRDGISGLLRIAGAGARGELYNICGGEGVSIGQILDAYRKLATVQFEIVEDAALKRPLEQKTRIGDASKLCSLGWKPEHRLDDTLRSIIDYWRLAVP
jgi:GDP-4-dehydro-6-deoxy-D-mannose reductase